MNDIYEPEYVKKLFNRMSNSYERMNFITSFGFSILWRKQFIKSLGTSNSEIKVLDLLSGLGENWSILLERFPNADFYALDFSEEMCKVSNKKNSTKFENKFKIHNKDVLKDELPKNYYDIITCAFGLKTFNENQIEELAQKTSKILKVNGKFSFIEISKPNNNILLLFYGFYLKRCIPFLGKVFLGNPSDYKMLWTYTDKFGNSKVVKEIFEKYNLEVKYEQYFFGCATGISGKKIS